MTLHIVLVEDEDVHAQRLKAALQNWVEKDGGSYELKFTGFKTGEEFLRSSLTDYDLIFMDIQLGGLLNGIEAASEARSRGCEKPLVLLTSHEEFSLMGYRVKAMDYLMKPVADGDIDRCMREVCREAERGNFLCREGAVLRKIPCKDILYVQSSLHYVDIITEEKTYRHRGTLKEVQKRLPGQFMQCHRTAVINVEHIETICGKELILRGNIRIPISRPCLDPIRKAYEKEMGLRGDEGLC